MPEEKETCSIDDTRSFIPEMIDDVAKDMKVSLDAVEDIKTESYVNDMLDRYKAMGLDEITTDDMAAFIIAGIMMTKSKIDQTAQEG
ncbi:MAG: hypothetical protein KKA99_04190 [Gammaproteobacteria bacterium]|nr:hypothetical protein [Gammaproteobacteria bacterium]MBU1628681.1 hypothetical protein [Gammaproteobacteria bacterium]MBU1927145.1 hypothetical protein [Gammaproteobacteria bacterium]MBU2546030.1 hypothetical protein [Gammaproteobacteria bacterium]